jgi:hypothetical protein
MHFDAVHGTVASLAARNATDCGMPKYIIAFFKISNDMIYKNENAAVLDTNLITFLTTNTIAKNKRLLS